MYKDPLVSVILILFVALSVLSETEHWYQSVPAFCRINSCNSLWNKCHWSAPQGLFILITSPQPSFLFLSFSSMRACIFVSSIHENLFKQQMWVRQKREQPWEASCFHWGTSVREALQELPYIQPCPPGQMFLLSVFLLFVQFKSANSSLTASRELVSIQGPHHFVPLGAKLEDDGEMLHWFSNQGNTTCRKRPDVNITAD